MIRSRILVPLILLAGTAACADAPTTPGVDCTIVFHDSPPITRLCTADVSATWTASTDSTVVLGGRDDLQIYGIEIRIQLAGQPTAGTFSSSDADATGFVFSSSTSTAWVATTPGTMTSVSPGGSWTLTIDSVTESGNTATGKNYTIRGTITATMYSLYSDPDRQVTITF